MSSSPPSHPPSTPTLDTQDNGFLRRARSMTTRGGLGFYKPPTVNIPYPLPSDSPLSAPISGDTPNALSFQLLSTNDTDDPPARYRRGSHDPKADDRLFYIDVAETEKTILAQEDTDGDFQITVNDVGPKALPLGSAASLGFRKYDVRGTYVLSNLLQELALAKDVGRQFIVLPESCLTENPVLRLNRMIATHFWAGLTRAIDRKGMQVICADPKNRSPDQSYKIYVPYDDHVGQAYYKQIMSSTDWGLQVHVLPPTISPEYVKTLDAHPGILSLALYNVLDPSTNKRDWKGVPFVVPGGRFNEMYGWDSYFETLGLVVDGRVELGKAMVDNFCYQISHYGKILNANRSYYLTRSQPPFLTDMARIITQHWPQHVNPDPECPAHATLGHSMDATDPSSWLRRVLMFAVREYYTVWTSAPRLHNPTGLSMYRTTGFGMPPETEASHFTHIMQPYADARSMTVDEFMCMYDMQAITEPDLDEYFLQDRAVRESGHDTTYRFEKKCADLLTIDLNALLFKYESDIADLIDLLGIVHEEKKSKCVPVPCKWRETSGMLALDTCEKPCEPVLPNLVNALGDAFADLWTSNVTHTSVPAPLNPQDACVWEGSQLWRTRAQRRAKTITELMWDQDQGLYFDYNTKLDQRSEYQTVTATWALWAGLATDEQAKTLVEIGLPRFEELGGLVSGTEQSRGVISLARPNRQWDYPFGWAPHQIIAWQGLAKYGFVRDAQRLAYQWLYTITKAFADFNGTVPEKFDVVTLNHILKVEYGNVGTDFKCVPREGFGWMNASYQVGLTYLDMGMRRKLGVLSPPDKVFLPTLK